MNPSIAVMIIPGLWSSGPQHWQTHWERTHPTWQRVEQRNYDRPDRGEWIATLDDAVRRAPAPPVLAAHSLGCSLVTHWAAERGGQGVAGAFLVAPSDVEAPNYPIEGRSFSFMSLKPLPFPSIVVASTNDVYVSMARAESFARAWGSRLVVIGDAGHINGDAGYGPWPEGEKMLIELCDSLSS